VFIVHGTSGAFIHSIPPIGVHRGVVWSISNLISCGSQLNLLSNSDLSQGVEKSPVSLLIGGSLLDIGILDSGASACGVVGVCQYVGS
jgi:hypothetical protein